MKEPVTPMKRWASSYSQSPDTLRSSNANVDFAIAWYPSTEYDRPIL